MATASLGEGNVYVASNAVGSVRVRQLYPEAAVFPRLGFSVAVQLQIRPDIELSYYGPNVSLAQFEVRELMGELRLSSAADAIGTVSWYGDRRPLRPNQYGAEDQIRLACDLDPWRLEQIERSRDGRPLRLWLQLWPQIVSTGHVIEAKIETIELDVPREAWLAVLAKIQRSQFDVVEIQYAGEDAARFQRALTHTKKARDLIANGDYDQAVAMCRNIIEALTHDLPKPESGDAIGALLERKTDAERAKLYTGIVSRIKQLAAGIHHDFGRTITYSRAEAQFAVRTTEAVLALIGALSHD